MQTQIRIGYDQILNLVYLLPKTEKKKLIVDLQKELKNNSERQIGKYDGQGLMSDDFNEPLEEFKEYMP
jgi:hypothetical protein